MNIYDIAKKCGVSISTVSRVMNNSGAVSEKTRQKVERAIEEGNFIPNSVARSLASNSTRSVGLMVPDVRNYFHAQAVYEIDELLTPQGYTTILCNTGVELYKKLDILNLQKEKKVDALITVGAAYGEEEFLSELKKLAKEIPVVQINNFCPGLISVYCDEKEGIRQAVESFKAKGYKKPIFISQKAEFHTRAYESKKEGFIEALERYYPGNEFVEVSLEDSFNEVSKTEKFILDNDFDAIQFENDNLAIKFLKAFLDDGIQIPQKVALVGFDNIDATNYTYKKISSIDHKIHEHALVAVNDLLKIIKDRDAYINYDNVIMPEFVEKETS